MVRWVHGATLALFKGFDGVSRAADSCRGRLPNAIIPHTIENPARNSSNPQNPPIPDHPVNELIDLTDF